MSFSCLLSSFNLQREWTCNTDTDFWILSRKIKLSAPISTYICILPCTATWWHAIEHWILMVLRVDSTFGECFGNLFLSIFSRMSRLLSSFNYIAIPMCFHNNKQFGTLIPFQNSFPIYLCLLSCLSYRIWIFSYFFFFFSPRSER